MVDTDYGKIDTWRNKLGVLFRNFTYVNKESEREVLPRTLIKGF